MADTWQELGAVAPADLITARLELHYAAQVVSGVGRTFLPPKDDDSHTNLIWLSSDSLASHVAPGDVPFRAELDFAAFELRLLGADEAPLADLSLGGRTLEEAYRWLGKAIETHAERTAAGGEFVAIHYEMPAHPVGNGAPFENAEPAAFLELSRWFHNADQAIRGVQTGQADAAPVRVWPHHFDTATLIELDKGKAVETPRTIGVGMTPGDDNYREPYWYVNVHPAPNDLEAVAWPPLRGGGHWHTTGFVAAILPGTPHVNAEDQPTELGEFLDSAIAGCRSIHGG